MKTNPTFRGDRLRFARLECKLTQAGLGRIIGIDGPTGGMVVSHWESGRREPSAKYIAELARGLNVTADFLLGVDE